MASISQRPLSARNATINQKKTVYGLSLVNCVEVKPSHPPSHMRRCARTVVQPTCEASVAAAVVPEGEQLAVPASPWKIPTGPKRESIAIT